MKTKRKDYDMNYESMTDGIRHNDSAAITEFYTEFYKDVYYICYKITGNESDAEEIANEVMFRATEKIELLTKPEGLPAWLKTIACNMSINYIKKNRKFDTISTYVDDSEESILDSIPAKEKIPEDIVADKEIADILLTMINRLPDEQKITVFMFYYQEMSVHEISQAMGCPEATVRSRLNYAKKSLRKQADALEDEGVRLRCIAILPFLAVIYSFEKYSVCANAAMPDIFSRSYRKRKEMNKKIKNHGFSGLAAGAKAAIGVISALIVAGGAAAIIAGHKSDKNDYTITGNNSTAKSSIEITPADNTGINTSTYIAFNNTYTDINDSLHCTAENGNETVIEGCFKRYSDGTDFVIYLEESDNGLSRLIITGKSGNVILDSNICGTGIYCLSRNEFILKSSEDTIMRYKISGDSAEQVWSLSMSKFSDIEYFGVKSYNRFQMMINDNKGIRHIINLTDGTLSYTAPDGIGVYPAGEYILCYSTLSDTPYVSVLDADGKTEIFHRDFTPDDNLEVVTSDNHSDAFVIKTKNSNGKYEYELINSEGKSLIKSDLSYTGDELSWAYCMSNIDVYESWGGSDIIYVNGTVYEADYYSWDDNREGYLRFDTADEKNYCLILETGAVMEYTGSCNYEDELHLGYVTEDNKISFFNQDGKIIYEYVSENKTVGTISLNKNYYNNKCCTYAVCVNEGHLTLIIPDEQRVVEYDNESFTYKTGRIGYVRNKYLLYWDESGLYTYDSESGELITLSERTDIKVVQYTNNFINIRYTTEEAELYRIN